MNTQTTSSDLKAKIIEHIEELAKSTDAARVSQEMLYFLDVCALPQLFILQPMADPDGKTRGNLCCRV